MSEGTKRTWIALAVAETVYAVAYPLIAFVMWIAGIAIAQDGNFVLGFTGVLFVFGVLAATVALPIAVHTVGRLTEAVTARWATATSALAHMAVGLALGCLAAALILPNVQVGWPIAFTAFALPGGIAALATRLIVPLAATRPWMVGVATGIGAVPVIIGLAVLAFLGMNVAGALRLALVL